LQEFLFYRLWRIALSVEANLLVTFDSRTSIEARNEVIDVLRDVGVEEPEFLYSEVKGLFQLQVVGDSKKITKKLFVLCRRCPSRFWFTYRWIPIETWCHATIEDMAQVVKEIAEGINPEERWRLSLNKRFYRKHHTRDLILKLAQQVDRTNVDLEHPEKIIRIEIIRERAGISLLTRKEYFSVNEVKNKALPTNTRAKSLM
jgi:tRNA(Ser,Leu) C12 N-acetylase TAN1